MGKAITTCKPLITQTQKATNLNFLGFQSGHWDLAQNLSIEDRILPFDLNHRLLCQGVDFVLELLIENGYSV